MMRSSHARNKIEARTSVTAYILRRMLLMIPTLIGIVTITFVIAEFVPGGPVDQVKAMLKGNAMGGGEVSGGGDAMSMRQRDDPRLEARLRRLYGLNNSRFERYLRTLLWFGADSIVTAPEIEQGTSVKFVSKRRNCIVARVGEDFYACVNRWQDGEVVFESSGPHWKSVLNGSTFDLATGAAANGGPGLEILPLVTETENEVLNVYLHESRGEAFSNWDNWHGFFLGKFGNSIKRNKTVIQLVKERLPVSASLGVISFFLTYFICLLLGIAKAVRHGSRFDVATSVIVLIGYSVPGFVLAVLLLVLFGPGDGHLVELIPLAGLTSSSVEGYETWSAGKKFLDYLHHLVAPIICLTIGSFAVLTMLTKNSMLEEIHKQYVLTARSKGLSERKVIFKHVLRNALIPLITGFPSGFLSMFFAGSLLIEQIFSLDGLGLLSYTAVIERDFPVVLGSLFVFTILGLIGQLLTDICYVVVDPRISFDESTA
jgi:microcin C transport system permease protein